MCFFLQHIKIVYTK
jgi:hypothetical protein